MNIYTFIIIMITIIIIGTIIITIITDTFTVIIYRYHCY